MPRFASVKQHPIITGIIAGGLIFVSLPKGAKKAQTEGGRIQSIIFRMDDNWRTEKAKNWLKRHDFRYGKVHKRGMDIRFRQFPPERFTRFRRVNDELGKGIDVIYGFTRPLTAKRRYNGRH